MLYQITHITAYEYSASVSLCQNLAHLTPRTTDEQQCLQTSLSISPEPAVLSSRTDYFGNQLTFFAVQEPHRKLTVTANHLVEVTPRVPIDGSLTLSWEEVRDRLRASRSRDCLQAYQFAFPSRHVPFSNELIEYARNSFVTGRPLFEAVLDLTARIHADFEYDPQATTISTPIHEVFQQRRGVCQDFSHLQISCLRSLGIPARYISGYLRTMPQAGKPRLVGADATHAWVSVFCPDIGWLDVDPTNNLQPSDKHVVLAWGRDFDDVSPVKGVILGGDQHSIGVSVDVTATEEK
ncbi:MAG: transglutaminase family protein [Planctomycetia bacterium]|nr:transglutaminase family protein [Planctomycetia bacterium]